MYSKSNADISDDKFALGCCCCISAIVGAMIYLIINGSQMVNEGEQYVSGATTETCFVVNWEFELCNCNRNMNNCGKKYKYEAIVVDKCGNKTLVETIDEGCESITPRSHNKPYTCYVFNCDAFSFRSGERLITSGKSQIIGGSIGLGIIGCAVISICICIICSYCINCIKKKKLRKFKYEKPMEKVVVEIDTNENNLRGTQNDNMVCEIVQNNSETVQLVEKVEDDILLNDTRYKSVKDFFENELIVTQNLRMKYFKMCIQNGYDTLDALKRLTRQDLIDMGIESSGDRNMILIQAKRIKING